jgi:hypothetical protein
MSRISRFLVCCTAISLAMLAGCSEQQGAVSAEGPVAPSMPANWHVSSDLSFPAGQIEPIAKKLGGEIAALRNTIYEVNGKRVQLNTILARDEASAGEIMSSMLKMKPDEFLLRKGLTLYEFVGMDDALPEMRAGRAHIEAEAPGS